MKKIFGILALLFVVRLYSGGICVDEWETKGVLHIGTRIAFIDIETGNSMQVCGCYTVENVKKITKMK
jgi:hypothetical protein